MKVRIDDNATDRIVRTAIKASLQFLEHSEDYGFEPEPGDAEIIEAMKLVRGFYKNR
jgi:hypothetical protein